MKPLVILACLLLVGCATPAPIDVQVSCPPLRTWTADEQAALATALSPIPPESMLWALERDWQATRDAIRACKAKPNT